MKPVRFLSHAQSAMVRRGLDPEMVRLVVEAPDAVVPGSRPGRRIYHRQMETGLPPTLRLLRVVEEDEAEIVVVTADGTSRLERYQGGP